jgi:8-oxo-dGTP pyrophosphatase MutT (NUDIX family)
VRTRPSSRVLLVDRRDRVLLVRVVHDERIVVPGEPPTPPTYWITPGGGTEGDESAEQTARRELFEETGIDEFDLGPFLHERQVEAVLDEEPLLAVERFYAGFVDEATGHLGNLDPLEVGVIVEHRWWTLDEITDEGRPDTIYPSTIGELAAQAIAARPRA